MKMSVAGAKNHVISVAAHRGDAKTLLAFDILQTQGRKGLAGFTVKVTPEGKGTTTFGSNIPKSTRQTHRNLKIPP
ncbi:hypothetical protein [Rhizobium leguminosarum]|uniref:hypothetical protein n=1 Tax=Rhizobium leguminosarum TaxID=384 RepID=UPI0018D51573|nr:hypothetical protein [Rhizobium leguminosarum]